MAAIKMPIEYLLLLCTLATASLNCRPQDVKKPQRDIFVKYCLATCIGLTESDQDESSHPCKFDTITGQALGDACTENFVPATAEEKMVGCEFHQETFIKRSSIIIEACDFIIFTEMMKWSPTAKVLSQHTNRIKDVLPFIQSAKEEKKKTWMRVGNPGNGVSAKDWSEIASDANLRKHVIKEIRDLLEKYDLDGVLIFWKAPGCPEHSCNAAYTKDRSGAISFYKELMASLLNSGRTVADYAHANDETIFNYLGADFHQIIIKYVNYTLLDTSGMTGTWKDTLEYSRPLPKMERMFKSIFKMVGPSLKKKAIYMRDLLFYDFALSSPQKNTIGARYNQSASKSVPLAEICKLFKSRNYTRVKNDKNQNYAYTDKYLTLYEDMDSVKAELDLVVKGFDMAGFFIETIFYDDVDGDCGSGKMPYIRMYAEALKGGNCAFKPIL